MKLTLNIIQPTSIAQERKVTIRNGRPMFYEDNKLKVARNLLIMGRW